MGSGERKIKTLVNSNVNKNQFQQFLTWFKTTQPLLKPINVKFALSRFMCSRNQSISAGSRWLIDDDVEFDEEDGVVGGEGDWRSLWSKSGVKSEAIGIDGRELHSSLHENSVPLVALSLICSTCKMSISSESICDETKMK